MENVFNKYETQILRLLFDYRGGELSTREIAIELNMHVKTAKKYLIKLYRRKWVTYDEKENRTMWRFNPNRFNYMVNLMEKEIT